MERGRLGRIEQVEYSCFVVFHNREKPFRLTNLYMAASILYTSSSYGCQRLGFQSQQPSADVGVPVLRRPRLGIRG